MFSCSVGLIVSNTPSTWPDLLLTFTKTKFYLQAKLQPPTRFQSQRAKGLGKSQGKGAGKGQGANGKGKGYGANKAKTETSVCVNAKEPGQGTLGIDWIQMTGM